MVGFLSKCTSLFLCSCPPRTFLPALCRIFLDECAPENVLEVTARAITYYLDVSAECTRRIVAVEGAIKALCSRLVVVDLSSRTSKDLGEQCVKVSQDRKLHIALLYISINFSYMQWDCATLYN